MIRRASRRAAWSDQPAGNLEGGAKYLGTYELRHGGWWAEVKCTGARRVEEAREDRWARSMNDV